MTGVDRLRAQVEVGASANVVLPREMLHGIEHDMEAAGQPLAINILKRE